MKKFRNVLENYLFFTLTTTLSALLNNEHILFCTLQHKQNSRMAAVTYLCATLAQVNRQQVTYVPG